MDSRWWLLLSVVSWAMMAAAEPLVVYVASNGDDRFDGEFEARNEAGTNGPVASLIRARDRVRELKRGGLTQPITVSIAGGTYDLAEPLALAPDDSGTEACPITWQAKPGDRVVLRGGRKVTGWRPYRGAIMQADLKAQGFGDVVFHQLFYNGRRQPLARHPNFDPEHPRTGGQAYIDEQGPRPRQEFVYEEGALPFDEWGDISQAEVVTTFGLGWNFAITPIQEVDPNRRLITVRPVRRPFEVNNRFIVRNVLGALDAPGEWYHDRKTGILYYWPPDNGIAAGEVVVPLLDNIVDVQGRIAYPHGYLNVAYRGTKDDFPMPADLPPNEPVEYVHFRGLRLEAARQNGFRLSGARNCSVTGCQVTGIGNVGINFGGIVPGHPEVGNPRVVELTGEPNGVGGGGQNLLANDPCIECRAVGNDVWSVGSDGIFLYGTGNRAENNHVYDIGLYDKDCAGVNLFGEGNVARRNTLHDMPRNAVFLKGTDNVVESNDIYNTVLETCDGGAIRMCQRNLVLRGNVIRHNRIVDTIGYGYRRGSTTYQSPYYTWGIYLDDFTCGTTVEGNIVVRTGRGGIHIHGGSDNRVVNNIVIDAALYQFENNPIRDRPVSGNLVQRNIFVSPGGDSFVYRLGKWVDGAVAFERNVVWSRDGTIKVSAGQKGAADSWEDWLARGIDQGSTAADPSFFDLAGEDYRLRKDSPAWPLGFEAIPADQIGCYEDADRASWPPSEEIELVHEEPVIRVAPVKPLDLDFEMDTPGRPPRHGDVSATRTAPIQVTNKVARSGRQSVRFTDGPNQPQVWQPRIFYPFEHREGRVRFRAAFRLDGDSSPRFVIDPRQYSHTGAREYFVGPALTVTPDGEVVARGKIVTKVPKDTWFTIDLVMQLGDGAPHESELTVAVDGRETATATVPHGSREFQRLERVVIMLPGEDPGTFYLDDVFCGPVE